LPPGRCGRRVNAARDLFDLLRILLECLVVSRPGGFGRHHLAEGFHGALNCLRRFLKRSVPGTVERIVTLKVFRLQLAAETLLETAERRIASNIAKLPELVRKD